MLAGSESPPEVTAEDALEAEEALESEQGPLPSGPLQANSVFRDEAPPDVTVEDALEAEAELAEPADSAAAPDGLDQCVECGSEEQLDDQIRKTFDVAVCWPCKKGTNEYDLMPKRDAVEVYLLTDADLAKMAHLEKKNPHKPTWTPMKLFLRKQVSAASLTKYGSEDDRERERWRRQEAKYARKRSAAAGGIPKKKASSPIQSSADIPSDDVAQKSKLPPPQQHVPKPRHVHTYGEESYDSREDTYSRVCSECGNVDTYEKL